MAFNDWIAAFEGLIGHHCGGGTAFGPPLRWAQQTIDTETNFDKADIVFITDGQAHLDDAYRKQFETWRDERGVKVLGIVIGAHYYGGNPVGAWCHEEICVGLSDPSRADDESVNIFSKV